MMWTRSYMVLDNDGKIYAKCTTLAKAVKAQDILEKDFGITKPEESPFDIVQDEIPVDVIEVDSQLLEL